ncbi:MAG: PAS domain S-box protein, partial [Desulfobacterales bacterium]|nr:PAS domain S-box protein [Desulfobacterales bacterium]
MERKISYEELEQRVKELERELLGRKRVEKALHESEQKYSALFKQSANSMLLVDLETIKIVEFNESTCKNLGYTKEEFEKINVSDFEVIESPEEIKLHSAKLIETGFDTFETKHRTKSGEIRNVVVNSKVITIGGKPHSQVIFTDITDIKQTEAALKESEARYRALFESVPIGIGLAAKDGRLLAFNDQVLHMTDYSGEELEQVNVRDFYFNPENREQFLARFQTDGFVRNLEVRLKRKDGTAFDASLDARPITLGGKDIILTVVQDTTAQKETERKLIESEERLNAFFIEAPAGLVILDEELCYVKVNETIAKINKLPVDEHTGKSVYEILGDLAYDVIPTLKSVLETGESVHYEVGGKIRGIDDMMGYWVSTAFPVALGDKMGVGNIVVDISERKRAEDALRRTNEDLEEKTRALEAASRYKSEFLANMSHELRTPLNSIILLSRHLAENRDGSLTQDHVESVQAISSSGSDLLALINQVLDLSRIEAGKAELSVEDVDLEDFAGGIKKSFQPVAAEKGLNLEVKLAAGSPGTIRTDQQRLEQIVKNFLSNAVKFTSRGSIILSIDRPGDQLIDETELSESGLDPAKAVSISVIDTGVGIQRSEEH